MNAKLACGLAVGFFFFYVLQYPAEAAPVVRDFLRFVGEALRTFLDVANTAANG